MTVQTTYDNEQVKGLAGMKYGNGHKEIQNAVNEEAATVPFGVLMVRGSAPGKVENPNALLPTGAADDVLGVVLRTLVDETPAGVAADSALDLMKIGQCWVLCEAAVTPGDDAFFQFTTANAGQFRADNDGGQAAQLVRARFETTAGAGEIALLTLEGVANNG